MIDTVTPGGKQVKLVVDSKSALFRFQFVPGGELPVELSGLYTSERYAGQALHRYLERMKLKEKK